MIELRNKRLSKHLIGNEKVYVLDAFFDDKALGSYYTHNVYSKGVGICMKPLEFEKLIEVSGEYNIENLVCYNNKPVPYTIDIDSYFYDWEKIYFEPGILAIKKHNEASKFMYGFCKKHEDWTYKYNLSLFSEALSSVNHDKVNINVEFDRLNGWYFDIGLKQKFISGNISLIYKELKKAIYEIEQELYLTLEGGFTWKEDYHTDEPKFTKEVMIPLLKKMKYKNVRYNHGTEEYGRDVIFSEINKFGEEIFYGIQVKAGDVSGGANSQIDTLIGQLEDAFSMPVKLLGDEHERYLSFFIIAISGHYKKNAKEKILKKVPQAYKPHVFFWDKDSIEDLTGTYWKAD